MRSSSLLSARSRIRTDGACGERAIAADTRTLASATIRRTSSCGRARRVRREAPRAPARALPARSGLTGRGSCPAASAGCRRPQRPIRDSLADVRASSEPSRSLKGPSIRSKARHLPSPVCDGAASTARAAYRTRGLGLTDRRHLMAAGILRDKAGRRRSPAATPGYRARRAPPNKGCATHPTRHEPRRSSPSCESPVKDAAP